MAEQRQIPEPGETIQISKASWGPALFAIGATGAIAGIYAGGFVFSAFIWSIVGIVILLFALRILVKTATRSYFGLPRRQYAPTGTVPIEQIRLESRPRDAQQQLPR